MKVFSMSNAIDKLPSEIHIVPIGEWKERGFRIEATDCDDIIRNFESFGIKLVIDYEHQSLNCMGNGAPAPAAGWIGKLEKRETGVWAVDIEWTEDAKKYIENKQYRYISPVIVFDDRDPHTDTWIGCSLHSVALTNTPYFRDDLEPIINNRFGGNKTQEPATTAGANKETKMTLEEQVAALTQDKAAQAAKIADLEQRLAARDAEVAEIATTRMVDDAIAAKKLLPAQREVGLIVAKQGKETFDKFIAASALPVDLTKKDAVPNGDDAGASDNPQAEWKELLKDAAKMEALKKSNPTKFEALRKAFYGGE